MTTHTAPQKVFDIYHEESPEACLRAALAWIKSIAPQLKPGDKVVVPGSDGKPQDWTLGDRLK